MYMIKEKIRRRVGWGMLLLGLGALALGGIAGGSPGGRLADTTPHEFPWQVSQAPATPGEFPWQISQAPATPGEFPWQISQAPATPGEFPWQIGIG